MLAGNMTRDPEVNYTPKGTAVCEFGLAVNRVYTANEEKREKVTFLDVEAWGKTAEIIGEHFSKGKPIFIQGRLKLDQWDDKETGKKRSKIRVICESFQFVGSKKDGGGGDGEGPDDRPQRGKPSSRQQSSGSRRPQREEPPPRQQAPHEPEFTEDDDIPF
jgi:single-strand DNA-binding protein